MIRDHGNNCVAVRGAEYPLVSAVVASKDRWAGVERLMGDIRRQDYPAEKLEVVVVDDGSEEA